MRLFCSLLLRDLFYVFSPQFSYKITKRNGERSVFVSIIICTLIIQQTTKIILFVSLLQLIVIKENKRISKSQFSLSLCFDDRFVERFRLQNPIGILSIGRFCWWCLHQCLKLKLSYFIWWCSSLSISTSYSHLLWWITLNLISYSWILSNLSEQKEKVKFEIHWHSFVMMMILSNLHKKIKYLLE